jgi:hypothetical protein
MSIIGPGSAALTVRRDTGGDYRIFFTNNRAVTISGMTITNGKTADGAAGGNGDSAASGGGILVAGGVVNLSDLVITDNRTGRGGDSLGGGTELAGSGGFGGGLSGSGSLTMNNCVVSNNIAGNGGTGGGGGGGGGWGGGMDLGGAVILTNVAVTGNRSGDSGSGPGGGLSRANSGYGGGIVSSANLTMTNVTISNNVVGKTFGGDAGEGGGLKIFSGSVTMTNSTVSNNRSGTGAVFGARGGVGGGIANSGTLTVVNSTINGNATGDSDTTSSGTSGGGIFSSFTLNVQNTTISGNSTGASSSSSGLGGGISASLATISNCTITGNTAFNGNGSGVSGTSSTKVRNTIIAGNPGNSEVRGTLSSQGRNLIGKSDGTNGFTNGINGDQVGTLGSPLNPQLGSLANNGGPTMTHALLTSSPALDAGDNCVTQAAHCGDASIVQLTSDQRGFNRIVDGPDADTTATVDIGAYEAQPALASIPDTSGNEDTQLLVAFDAGDPSTITSVTAVSDNVTLIPNDSAHLSTTVAGTTGQVTINPATNLFGTANITVTVNRTAGSASKTFALTINPVNDAPSFTKGADQTINEDAGAQSVSGWATNISTGPANEAGQTLTFQVTGNTNTGLFSVAPAISPTGTLTYTPAANANGSATITIVLVDNGGTANGGQNTSAAQTFNITVNAVNDAPSFTKGPDQTVNEDSGFRFVSNWATNISAGASDESGQALTFTVTNNTNAALFSTAPSISSFGQLSFSPATNANGSATITIVLKDSGGTANGGIDTSAPPQTFTITVNPLNDAPSFTRGANQTVNEDPGPQTVTNWATSILPGPTNEAGQTVSFAVTNNTNASLFSAGPTISSTGGLTYTPAANVSGSASITIVLKDDGGTANGGVDTSPPQTFTITVNSANDAPSFAKGADQNVNNNAGAQSITNWATNISPGPANESSQTVSFQVTGNNNPGLFAVAPAITSTGTLTYQPAINGGGTATIAITLVDDGGTANGGQDTSPAQTFNININPIGGSLRFTSDKVDTAESSGSTTITVMRSGDLSQAVTVDYATSGDQGLPCSIPGGVASPKCDFTSALGTLAFAANEDTKTITVLINQDSFVEGTETLGIFLSNPTAGAALGTPSTASINISDDLTEPATNPIDDSANFVRQHYHDFLNREPDAAGFQFWTNSINNCAPQPSCTEIQRVNTSAAFFLSIEFQDTGYFVERLYRVAYGNGAGLSLLGGAHQVSVPIIRFNEFLPDSQEIQQNLVVGQTGWESALENNKRTFTNRFVQRSRFTTSFPASMTAAVFVDTLNTNAGNPLSQTERDQLVNDLAANVKTRAQVLRAVAEDPDLKSAEFNRAFVLMEYFGYLRRNPNDSQDTDYTGYDFWLTKLNQANGNYLTAEMCKSFIIAGEYRNRFGP